MINFNAKQIGEYIHNSKTPYVVLNHKGEPIFWNQTAYNILPEFFEKHNGLIGIAYLDSLMDETSVSLSELGWGISEVNIPISTTEYKTLSISTTKNADGSYLLVLDDITSRNKREKSLQKAKDLAEKTNVERSLFLANVSHEIKTPIQIMVGMLDLLKMTNLDTEQKEYIRQIGFGSEVLLALVNDVLDFSKLEAGQVHIEHIEFNLHELLEHTTELIALEAHKKGLEIILDIQPELPYFVIGDPKRIQQVLFNLLKNAVKFTEKGSVSLSVKFSESKHDFSDNSNSLSFFIADTGIGIDNQKKEKLFSPFVQADISTSRKYGGTGLGLAISKELVHLMKGEIKVYDNKPNGSVFWFSTIFDKSTKTITKKTLPIPQTTRFLIVDDNIKSTNVIKSILYKFGFTDITEITNGEKAIELMLQANKKNNNFHIVFIDMLMPKMDGWRLGCQINNHDNLKDAKTCLMIPEGTLESDAKMKLLDWFDGYLYKPVHEQSLFEYLITTQTNIEDLPLELIPISDSITDENTTLKHNSKNIEKSDINRYSNIHNKNNTPIKSVIKKYRLKILVVEDNHVNRQVLTLLLNQAGCTVISVENGLEAVNFFESDTVDLAFMDIQMPVLNGYEASKQIRDKGIQIPIIACTASAQANENKFCELFGITDILLKPFNFNTLLEILKKYSKN